MQAVSSNTHLLHALLGRQTASVCYCQKSLSGLPSSGLGNFQVCVIKKGEREGENSPCKDFAQIQLTLAIKSTSSA